MIFDSKYKQIKQIGAGAFGKVFLAEEILTKRKVAIKIIQQASRSSERMLMNEIQQISKFQHHNIIGYYHHFHQNGLLHLVMEYCEGGSLRQKLQAKNYQTSEVIDWAISLTSALREIHKKGVFHKDIKPDNILFTKNGKIKLSDFGIANLHAGTISYMSPEALAHDHTNQRLIDIYALGITISEMLIGEHPFSLLSKKEVNTMRRDQNYPTQGLPEWQQEFIKKAIHPDPIQRFQFMAEMEECLKAQAIPIEFNESFFHISKIMEVVEKELLHKKWIKALHLLETIDKKSPNELLIHQGFANYHLQRGEYEKAKKRINQAFKLNNRIPFFKELGWIYLEECSYQKVIPLLSDYLRRQPKDLEGFNLLIRAYFETNRMDEAMKLSKILHEQHPKFACFLNNYLVSLYCTTYKSPLKNFLKEKKINHPLIDYNFSIITQQKLSKYEKQSKLIFMNFNHNIMNSNEMRIEPIDSRIGNSLKTTEPIIKICKNFNEITFNENKNFSCPDDWDCVILNSKNDVWIYNLNSSNQTSLDGEKINIRRLLTGVQKLSIEESGFWVHSDAEKLL